MFHLSAIIYDFNCHAVANVGKIYKCKSGIILLFYSQSILNIKLINIYNYMLKSFSLQLCLTIHNYLVHDEIFEGLIVLIYSSIL